MSLCLPSCQLFEVHGSKLKPHPIGNLGQATVRDYDKELYKQRNQVERLFRRIKRFRRIFTRYVKLDVIFLTFVYFALAVDALM